MLALLGTLVGGIAGVLPGILDLIDRKMQFKYHIDKAKVDMEVMKYRAEKEIDIEIGRAQV